MGPALARPLEVDPGETLLESLQCQSCHNPSERTFYKGSGPVVGKDGLAVTPQFLRAYLLNPTAAQPGTTMPDALHSLGESGRAEVVEDLVHFLVSQQTPAAKAAFDPGLLNRGRELFHTVGCVACHAPSESLAEIHPKNPDAAKTLDTSLKDESVPFGPLAKKYEHANLAKFLKDPTHFHPSGRMPSLSLNQSDADAIAMYLLREQSSKGEAQHLSGIQYRYYEGDINDLEDLEKLTPLRGGVQAGLDLTLPHRAENFGVRFEGQINVTTNGSHGFEITSDDGSRLFIDGQMVVDNGGTHAPQAKRGKIDLKPGAHSILVTFFNGGSGSELQVKWQPPGAKRELIPASALSHSGLPMQPLDDAAFASDPARAARGKQAFAQYNCAACHTGTDTVATAAKPLAELAANNGCLADAVPAKAPKFAFNDTQRASLRKVISNPAGLRKARTPAEQINHTMAVLNCAACHQRDGNGGPVPGRLAYFSTINDVDLGDEGRIPPLLTRVGGKLREDWLGEVLLKHGAVRPYMATRMPQFGEAAVAKLPALFSTADGSFGTARVADYDSRAAKSGRKLVGTGGLTCVSCHTFADHKSLGIPAIDLTTMTKRLRKEWFQVYMINPASLRPGTRMPTFWPDGKAVNTDVLDGNTANQIDAVWAYLSKGREAEVPAGLVVGRKELVADKEAVIYRNFITGGGTRAIGVGYPEKVNLAFDANDLRLALIWQGAFMDTAHQSTGRGEGFEPPLGDHLLAMPQGPALARLADNKATWPTVTGRKGGFQMRGYELDKDRRPAFLYSFDGVEVEDLSKARAEGVDMVLARTLKFKTAQNPANLWFRAAVGKKIEAKPEGYLVDDKLMIRVKLSNGGAAVIRGEPGAQELILPVTFKGGEALMVEELVW